MHVAFVVPLKRMPAGVDGFDYEVPVSMHHEIRVGQIVKVPLRNQRVNGLVWSIGKNTKRHYTLKPIIRIISLEPVIDCLQREILVHLALHAHASLSTVLRMILPSSPERFAAVLNQPQNIKTQQYVAAAKNKAIKLHWHPSSNVLNHAVATEAIVLTRRNAHTLIVCPTIDRCIELKQYLCKKKNLAAHIFLLNSSTSASQQRDILQMLKYKTVPLIILATRSGALQIISTNLDAVIVDHVESKGHIECEQQPRYSITGLLDAIADHAPFSITYHTVLPSVIQFQQLKPAEPMYTEQPEVTISSGDYFQLFAPAITNLLTAKTTNQVLVVFPYRYATRVLRCADCSWFAICQQCNTPLTEVGGTAACPHADSEPALVDTCPQCHGVNLRWYGEHLRAFARRLAQAYPAYKIIIDEEVSLISTAIKDSTIVCTTPQRINTLANISWDAVIVVGPEMLLSRPTYSINEELFHTLHEAYCIANTAHCPLHVQTRIAMDHPSIAWMSQHRPATFYTAELCMRERFGYPPFVTLLQVLVDCPSTANARESHRVLREIKKRIYAALPYGIPCYGPASLRTHRKGFTRQYFLVKLPPQQSSEILEVLHRALGAQCMFNTTGVLVN